MDRSCPFCRIVAGALPSFTVAENETVVVFLSKENHPLVVPRRHVPDIYALDDETGAALMAMTIRVARAVKIGLRCDGVYLTQANEAAAGQDVFHLHIHVYPRWRDVELRAQQHVTSVSDADKQRTCDAIKAALAEWGIS